MDKPMRVLAVVASQAGGNTDRLVGHVLKAAADAQPGLSPTTVHLGAGPLDPAGVESSMQSLAAADAVLLGTPMFRSTYAAVLKEFLERVPRGGPNERFDGPLRAKAVGIVATGGSHHHFLGADPLIDVLVRYFGAYVVPPVLYGVIRTGADPEATLVEDAARFGRALVGLGAAIRSDARLGDARAQI
ncbi:MAG TPA: NAD(P)H-dependent oxidoreductase [Methylomirabilota bacterium]|nr:NAD(P)H-dependent oxidoreductase [Methylomirabilota bacterium]